MMLLEPKKTEIDGKTYILHKFPCIAGREIISKYPLSSVPKLGDYATNEEVMLKLMSYVCAISKNKDGKVLEVQLNDKMLVEKHVPSWETLIKIEKAMLEYNCSFLEEGLISSFLGDLVQNFPQWISKMLTGLLEGLSEQEKLRSTNSEQSTP